MEPLQDQLNSTLQMVLVALESMGTGQAEEDAAVLSRVAELEAEWTQRRDTLLEMVKSLSLRIEAVEATGQPAQSTLPAPQSDADQGFQVCTVCEPRLAAGMYHIAVANAEDSSVVPVRVGIDVTALPTGRRILLIANDSEVSAAAEVKSFFTVQPEEAPAKLQLHVRIGTKAPCVKVTLHRLIRGPKRFIFFNSESLATDEVFCVSTGCMEDIAGRDSHDAVLAEAVQRRICMDQDAAREANRGRLFLRYHRQRLPSGTYTHFLKSRQVGVPDQEETRAGESWRNPPGQALFFLRHGATDLFAFRDMEDTNFAPLESVDYIRVPPESQRTSSNEDEVEYYVALDGHPNAVWRRMRDSSIAFSSREELMDCVRNPTEYQAEMMLELV